MGENPPNNLLSSAFKISDLTIKSVELRLENISNACGVTVSTIYQAAFEMWLSAKSARENSIRLPPHWPQCRYARSSIHPGNCANFFPFCATVNAANTLSRYLGDTQDRFWEATEHGNVGPDDVYAAAGTGPSRDGQQMFLPISVSRNRQNLPKRANEIHLACDLTSHHVSTLCTGRGVEQDVQRREVQGQGYV